MTISSCALKAKTVKQLFNCTASVWSKPVAMCYQWKCCGRLRQSGETQTEWGDSAGRLQRHPGAEEMPG